MGLTDGCLFCNIPFSRVYHQDVCHACATKLARPFVLDDRKRILERLVEESRFELTPRVAELLRSLAAFVEEKK
jgi:hypothetical protein